MSTKEDPQPAEPQKAANNGLAAELSDEALRNLTGFFDVLIQMDLEHKSNERSRYEESTLSNPAVNSAEADRPDDDPLVMGS